MGFDLVTSAYWDYHNKGVSRFAYNLVHPYRFIKTEEDMNETSQVIVDHCLSGMVLSQPRTP
jgi:hypothetical protein